MTWRGWRTRLRAIWTLLRGGSVIYGIGFYGQPDLCLPPRTFIAENVELQPGQHIGHPA